MNKGFYLVFEGITGSGKTTQVKKLAKYLREKYPDKKIVLTREPGGSEIADKIRQVVQVIKFDEGMDPICEAYLYAASRAQTLRKVVQPILVQRGIVISDRSFVSSLAFQGGGRQLGLKEILKINQTAIGHLEPNLIVYLDLDVKASLRRCLDQDGDKFEMKGAKFFTKVARSYRQASRLNILKNKWLNVDASGSEGEVFARIIKAINPYLK